MKAVARRLSLLEDRFTVNKARTRVLYRIELDWEGPVNLATSTCTRYLTPGGIVECIEFDGSRAALNPEELDAFVDSFPVTGEDGREWKGPIIAEPRGWDRDRGRHR